MVKLVLDVGNTRTKIAVFIGDTIIETRTIKGKFISDLGRLIQLHGNPVASIVATVAATEQELRPELEAVIPGKLLFIRSGLKLPVKNNYKTPQTLGHDRLANACGAWKYNQNKNSLVIDLGTCIKYDFIDATGAYHGGAISPGLAMRYKALTRFTGQLPYFKPVEEFPALIGQSTESSIRSGVENGILEELKGTIAQYRTQFDPLDVILTGGDHPKFADKLKSAIFVAPNLTLNGLKEILDYND